jgi:hypothetical protein
VRGVSDILGIIGGRPLAIEVKSKTGRLTEHQREFLSFWRAAGGVGFVARSVEDCRTELQRQLVALEGVAAVKKLKGGPG